MMTPWIPSVERDLRCSTWMSILVTVIARSPSCVEELWQYRTRFLSQGLPGGSMMPNSEDPCCVTLIFLLSISLMAYERHSRNRSDTAHSCDRFICSQYKTTGAQMASPSCLDPRIFKQPFLFPLDLLSEAASARNSEKLLKETLASLDRFPALERFVSTPSARPV